MCDKVDAEIKDAKFLDEKKAATEKCRKLGVCMSVCGHCRAVNNAVKALPLGEACVKGKTALDSPACIFINDALSGTKASDVPPPISTAVQQGLSAVDTYAPVKVSAALSTVRFNILDLFTHGAFFYQTISDQDISVAGIPFTIVQPCRLADGNQPAHTTKLLVSHDDKPTPEGHAISGFGAGQVSRTDVGHIAAYAALHPSRTTGLKFDMCADTKSKPSGTEEEEIERKQKKSPR